MEQAWKTCSSCKKEIGFNTKYWICSVSTCNQKRTGWVFCKVECWDAHIPKMSHRECWAEERHSPGSAAQGHQTDAHKTKTESPADEEAVGSSPLKSPPTAGTKTIVRRRA